MKRSGQSDHDSWQFFLANGELIGTFPPGFHVNATVFVLVMKAHYTMWHTLYGRS
jgi:hypothetical protein